MGSMALYFFGSENFPTRDSDHLYMYIILCSMLLCIIIITMSIATIVRLCLVFKFYKFLSYWHSELQLYHLHRFLITYSLFHVSALMSG